MGCKTIKFYILMGFATLFISFDIFEYYSHEPIKHLEIGLSFDTVKILNCYFTMVMYL